MNSSRHMRALALALPALLVLSAGCDIAMADHREKASEQWSKKYELQAGGRVEIGNVNGKIEVLPGEGNAVEIVATKVARGATAETAKENLRRIDIRESTSGGAIKVETHVERSSLFNNGGVSVEYAVRVPKGAELKVSTVNGGVEVTGLSGRVIAETTNGGIKAREIGGSIEATTTNGGIEVDLVKVAEGGAKLECTNGGIHLRIPSDAKASISARVTNGGIDTPGLEVRATESSRRRLDGDLNGGGPRLSLEGMNGGIKISAR